MTVYVRDDEWFEQEAAPDLIINVDGNFVADTVLAKHDENYMPPEVGESLAKHAAKKSIVKEEAGNTE